CRSNLLCCNSGKNPILFYRKLPPGRKRRGTRIRLEPLLTNRDYFLAYAARLHEVGDGFRETDWMRCALIKQVSIVDSVVVVVPQVKAAFVGPHSFIEIAIFFSQFP